LQKGGGGSDKNQAKVVWSDQSTNRVGGGPGCRASSRVLSGLQGEGRGVGKKEQSSFKRGTGLVSYAKKARGRGGGGEKTWKSLSRKVHRRSMTGRVMRETAADSGGKKGVEYKRAAGCPTRIMNDIILKERGTKLREI